MGAFLLLFRLKFRVLLKTGLPEKKKKQNLHISLLIYDLKKFQKIVLSQLIMSNLPVNL